MLIRSSVGFGPYVLDNWWNKDVLPHLTQLLDSQAVEIADMVLEAGGR